MTILVENVLLPKQKLGKKYKKFTRLSKNFCLLYHCFSCSFSRVPEGLVQRVSEATGYQCEIVGLKWLSDCLAAGRLLNRSDFILCEPRPAMQASASPQPEKQPFTNVVDDEKLAAAAEKAKRKREWVTLAANQSFTPDWEESPPHVAVSQSSAVVKSEAPTAPVNHNKERKICLYENYIFFIVWCFCLRISRCRIHVERAGFSCLALHVVQAAIS